MAAADKSSSQPGITLTSLYLFVYNMAQAAGWFYAAYLAALHFQAQGVTLDTFASAAPVVAPLVHNLCLFSLVEILHNLLGLVRSGLGPLVGQTLARCFMSLIALQYADATYTLTTVPTVSIFLSAWILSELNRFPTYALKSINACPWILTYLRYTLFIVLYPLGAAAEVASIFISLPVQLQKPFLPEYQFYVVSHVMIALIIPGFFYNYLFMWRQRNKFLNPKDDAATPKRTRPGKKEDKETKKGK